MSGYITLRGEDYLLGVLAGLQERLDSFYIALCPNAQPTRFNNGYEIIEVGAPGYTRARYYNETFTWEVIGGELRNVVPVEFLPADTDWEPVNYWAICSDEYGGDVLWAGQFNEALTVVEGSQVIIPSGGLILRASNDTLRVNL